MNPDQSADTGRMADECECDDRTCDKHPGMQFCGPCGGWIWGEPCDEYVDDPDHSDGDVAR